MASVQAGTDCFRFGHLDLRPSLRYRNGRRVLVVCYIALGLRGDPSLVRRVHGYRHSSTVVALSALRGTLFSEGMV